MNVYLRTVSLAIRRLIVLSDTLEYSFLRRETTASIEPPVDDLREETVYGGREEVKAIGEVVVVLVLTCKFRGLTLVS